MCPLQIKPRYWFQLPLIPIKRLQADVGSFTYLLLCINDVCFDAVDWCDIGPVENPLK